MHGRDAVLSRVWWTASHELFPRAVLVGPKTQPGDTGILNDLQVLSRTLNCHLRSYDGFVVRFWKIEQASLLCNDGCFPVLPLGTHILQTVHITGLSSVQMLVGTVAFNTLAVIEPTSSSALSIWTLGYVFQGLGMSIAFIVSPDTLYLTEHSADNHTVYDGACIPRY